MTCRHRLVHGDWCCACGAMRKRYADGRRVRWVKPNAMDPRKAWTALVGNMAWNPSEYAGDWKWLTSP